VIVSTARSLEGDFCKRGLRFGRITCTRIAPARFRARTLSSLPIITPGCAVFDIRNQFRPEEVGFFIPPAPKTEGAHVQ